MRNFLLCLMFAADVTIELGQPTGSPFTWRTEAPPPPVPVAPQPTLDEDAGPPIPQRKQPVVVLQARYAAQQRTKLTGYAPSWCAYCQPAKARLADHPLYEINWLNREPPAGVAVPAVQDPAGVYHTGAALGSWGALLRAMRVNKPAKLTLGTVSREEVERAVNMVRLIGGDAGEFRRRTAFHQEEGAFTFDMQAGTLITWDTAQDGSMQFVFSPPAVAGLSGLRQQVSAVVVGANGVTLKIDWLPDAFLKYR